MYLKKVKSFYKKNPKDKLLISFEEIREKYQDMIKCTKFPDHIWVEYRRDLKEFKSDKPGKKLKRQLTLVNDQKNPSEEQSKAFTHFWTFLLNYSVKYLGTSDLYFSL